MFFSLRVRLLLLAAVAIAPLIAERIYTLEISRQDSIRLAEFRMLDLARQGADAQDDVLTSARAILKTVALSDITRKAGPACNEYAREVVQSAPGLSLFSVASPSGQVICSSQDAGVGLNISDRDYFRDSLRLRTSVVSGYFIGKISGRPHIALASPKLAADGSIEAILIASIDLNWLNRLMESLSLKNQATGFIVDKVGNIVARYPALGNPMGQDYVNLPVVQDIISRDFGATRNRGLNGTPSIFGFVRLHEANAWVALGVGEDELLRGINKQINNLYLALAIVILLILAGVNWGGELFVLKPIRLFVAKALRAGHGKFDGDPVHRNLPTEFVTLDAALDRMARKLDARETELQTANRHLNRLARTAALTGLENRRSFDTKLRECWRDSAQRHLDLAVLMIDVDWFKAYNDRHGHVEGDRCLQIIAAILKDRINLCPGGVAARYGGEEFVLLLPETTQAGADRLAQTIRSSIAAASTADTDGPAGTISVSIGLAHAIPGGKIESQELVERADAALYEAKAAGRDCVRSYVAESIRMAG